MSKRKINLFGGPLLKLSKKAQLIQKIKYYSIAGSFVLFILILFTYIVRAKLIGDIVAVQHDQDAIELAITKEIPRQKDLEAILVRLRKIKEAMKNDVMFASRSAQINSLLDTFPARPKVQEITLGNPQEFSLKLEFMSQRDMLEFVRLSESPSFNKKLQTYSIGSFKITMASSEGALNLVDFSGTLL